MCSLASSRWLFFGGFIALGGYGLSTIWVAGRRLLLDLAPPGQVGKYFGLYNVCKKLSMIGVLMFGIIADITVPGIPAGGYRAGLLVQSVTMAVGAAFIFASLKHHD
jgi:MFS-type transporter involved in bile tolerance (Atg22 family)